MQGLATKMKRSVCLKRVTKSMVLPCSISQQTHSGTGCAPIRATPTCCAASDCPSLREDDDLSDRAYQHYQHFFGRKIKKGENFFGDGLDKHALAQISGLLDA
jgi:hypothetical protein